MDQKQQTCSVSIFQDRLQYIYSHEASLPTNKINTFYVNLYGYGIISRWILGIADVSSAIR